MSALILAGVTATCAVVAMNIVPKIFRQWEHKRFEKYQGAVQRHLGGTPEQVLAKHTKLLVGVYAFCPHCFSVRVFCKANGKERMWVCHDCGAHSDKGSYLTSLVAWHRKNYEKEYRHKVEHE